MSKKHKEVNVPNLRFTEFNNSWTLVELSKVCDIVSGGTPNTNCSNYWNGNINWFTPAEISNEKKYVNSSIRKITNDGLNNSSAKLLKKGDILFTSRASIGEAAILVENASTNQGFQSLSIKENAELIINNNFLYYSTNSIKKQCQRIATGSTFKEVSNRDLSKCKIYITEMEEQNKIAHFLSLIDEKIETQNKIIGELKCVI